MVSFNELQGVGSLKLIGPAGLSEFLNVITPFVNKKYPEIEAIEIDNAYSKESPFLTSVSPFWDIYVVPVFAENNVRSNCTHY